MTSWRRRVTGGALVMLLALSGAAVAGDEGSSDTPADSDAGAAVWAMPSPLVLQSLLLDVAFAGEFGVAVGERGHVLISNDGGHTWSQSRVPTQALLTAVALLDPEHLWAVGHDATVLFSSDRGATWTRQHEAPEWEQPLFDVHFFDAQHGLASGAYGLLLETRDGGTTWDSREIDEAGPHLYGLAPDGRGNLYAAGEFGSVFASPDSGSTWERLPSPYGGTFFGVLSVSGDLFVYGLRGNLFSSADRGVTWTRVETGTTAGLQGATVFPDGRVLFTGQAGTLLWSEPGAAATEAVARTDRSALAGAGASPHGVVVVGEGGVHRLQAEPPRLEGGP